MSLWLTGQGDKLLWKTMEPQLQQIDSIGMYQLIIRVHNPILDVI